MFKKFVTLFCVLVPLILFGGTPTRTLVKSVIVPSGSTKVDSISFSSYNLSGYFSFYAVAFSSGVNDSVFSVNDSIRIAWTTWDIAPILYENVEYIYWTDQNDSTQVYNTTLNGLEGVPLNKVSLTPKVCSGLKFWSKYWSTNSGDSAKVFLILEVQ